MSDTFKTAYLAPEGLLGQLLAELPAAVTTYENLVLVHEEHSRPRWVQNVWFDARIASFGSISEAARFLKAQGRFWSLLPLSHHRRAHLIQDQLGVLKNKSHEFGQAAPTKVLGSWGLIDAHTMIYAARCSSPFPHGDIMFNENHRDPPSRAYLKLWELFTLLNVQPAPQSRCLELGAAPGGWSWVLAKHCDVELTAIDKAELSAELMLCNNIQFVKGDAFALKPEQYQAQPFDWFFSDIICYPDKLYATVMRWLEADSCRNFVCTLKFQGSEHYGCIDDFAKIPGSELRHLSHNKHELTWSLVRDPSSCIPLQSKAQSNMG